MTDLITRIEAAKEPRQELFEEAFQALGNELFLWERDYQHPNTTAFLKWRRFDMMLDAQAWTSAAEMLLEPGIEYELRVNGFYSHEPSACHAWLNNGSEGRAAHPSLALLAAILRAERKDDE
ncbi:MAG: hypothetical protein ACOY7T_08190 [Pseudomonadota bacterium]